MLNESLFLKICIFGLNNAIDFALGSTIRLSFFLVVNGGNMTYA